MSINKIIEFAKTGDKNTTDLDLERGFPSKLKPARQWWNYLFNLYALKINEIIDGKLDGDSNAVSATKLETARTISFTGAVSGSGDFDGTGNLSIETSLLVGLGVDQTTQNLTASRALGVTYTNSTGKPIVIYFGMTTSEIIAYLTAVVDGVRVAETSIKDNWSQAKSASFIVPNDSTYSISGTGLSFWSELR